MKYDPIPHITQIFQVEPFKVVCEWNTGEIRVSDFGDELEAWQTTPLFQPLTNYEAFRSVTVGESGTLEWPAVLIEMKWDGKTWMAALDFDPIVLYETSKPLSAYRLVPAEDAA